MKPPTLIPQSNIPDVMSGSLCLNNIAPQTSVGMICKSCGGFSVALGIDERVKRGSQRISGASKGIQGRQDTQYLMCLQVNISNSYLYL